MNNLLNIKNFIRLDFNNNLILPNELYVKCHAYARTPLLTDNSTRLATTEWVNHKLLSFEQPTIELSLDGFTTTDLAEGNNLYWTEQRFDVRFGDKTTSDLIEGFNLYYTQERFDAAFNVKTTTDLTEGVNLYYTDTRVRNAIGENILGIEYSTTSGIFSLTSGYVIPTQLSIDEKVPYIGATNNVNLGVYGLTAGNGTFGGIVRIEATGNQSRALFMVTGTDGAHYGYGTGVNLVSEAIDNLTVLFSTPTTTKKVILNGANITTAKTYTLPNLTGTLALTSDFTGYATEVYVNTAVANLVDSSPATLDTLNELAAALGDDPNFATTITTLIGTKEPTITAGNTSQYWRGDKTWQTLPTYTLAGLGGEPIITAGTTSQYWRGDKTWQTLPVYSLPTASATTLGGIKVGNNLSIDGNGILSAGNSYVLPIASATVLGGIKIGTNLSIDGNGVVSSTDTITTSLPWTSITGRPTNLSDFTNNLGNYGNWVVSNSDAMLNSLTVGSNIALYNNGEIYTNIRFKTAGWFVNNTVYTGLMNTATAVYFASKDSYYWDMSSDASYMYLRFFTDGNQINPRASFKVDNTNNFYINDALSNWRVRIDTSGVTLYGASGCTDSFTAPAFYESSDIRYKNVLETNPTLTLEGLNVIKFTRKGSSQIRYGYSAQQVKSLSEDLIGGTKDEMTVNYSDVHTLKIAALEKRILELEAKLDVYGK